MAQTALLADIDNTLYDWPAFFAPSFRAMIHALARELAVSEEQLYAECKTVFQKRRSLEYAFLIQELESVRSLGTPEISRLIKSGRGAFRSVQRRRLVPYPGVLATLNWLRANGVLVVGVTNSPAYRAQHRLFDLGLDSHINGLVAWEGFEASVDDKAVQGFVKGGHLRTRSRLSHVWTLPEADCKPSERHYSFALDALGLSAEDAWAIGDSLSKDLEPAARLGIRTIWARYGAGLDSDDTSVATLLKITHWSPSRIHATYNTNNGFQPDVVVDSFDEVRRHLPTKLLTLF